MPGKVERFCELVKARIRPEGSVSPDGKRIKRGGKWVHRSTGKSRTPKPKIDPELRRKSLEKANKTIAKMIRGRDMAKPGTRAWKLRNESVRAAQNHVGLENYVDLDLLSNEAKFYFRADYEQINSNLRNGYVMSPALTVAVDALRSYMQPLSHKVRAFRGLNFEEPEEEEALRNAKRLPVDSFLSVSTDVDIADDFKAGRKCCMLEIDIPAGTNVVVSNFGESEIVVDFGKYELDVTSRRTDETYGEVLSCKLVKKK